MADNTVDAGRLRELLWATANDMASYSQKLSLHVARATTAASDQATETRDEAHLFDFLSKILHNLMLFAYQFDLLQKRAVENAALAADLQNDAERLATELKKLRAKHSTAATIALGLLSSRYVSLLIANDKVLSYRMLQMIGYDEVKAWVDAGGETVEL